MRKDRRVFLGALVTAASGVLGGCAGTAPRRGPQIAGEPIPDMSVKRLGNKYIHTRSFQQQMMLLGLRSGYRVVFAPDSDDFFVQWSLPSSWSDALIRARSLPGIHIEGGPRGKTMRLKVRDGRPNPYEEMARYSVTLRVLRGDKFGGKYIVATDWSARGLVSQVPGSPSSRYPLGFLLDRLYGVGKTEGKKLYFDYDDKANILRVTTSPAWIRLTPYKRQYFVNFLQTSGIDYIANDKNEIAVSDNFTNWVKAMTLLRELLKYSHMVYGIYDGRNFFESADSNYRSQPITVEMIDWTPNGAREYNIYAGGYHRKITTGKRFFTYYLPDGTGRYIIRFY